MWAQGGEGQTKKQGVGIRHSRGRAQQGQKPGKAPRDQRSVARVKGGACGSICPGPAQTRGYQYSHSRCGDNATGSWQRSVCCHSWPTWTTRTTGTEQRGKPAACESGSAVLFYPEINAAPGHMRHPKPPSLVSHGWGYRHPGALILSLGSLWTHSPDLVQHGPLSVSGN